uniref:Uncharacterized protein n=1 Tax=Amphimedon queenslandica TaxID=400682 RepID=A0A1X7SXH7_AMPQE
MGWATDNSIISTYSSNFEAAATEMSGNRKRTSSTQLTQFFKRVNKESTISEPVVNDASLMTEDNEMDTEAGATETSSTTETTATTEKITSTATTLTSASNIIMEEVDGLIDLGVVIREGNGSWDKLKSLVQHLPDEKKKHKALGKDGVLVSHSKSIMHVRATERADLFLRNFERIDSRLLQQ